jgi:hypothetical protein
MLEMKCDKCREVMTPISVFKKDRRFQWVTLKISKNQPRLVFDVCPKCSMELVRFFGCESFEELIERNSKDPRKFDLQIPGGK